MAGELASCGEQVLALSADAELRAGMSGEGLRLADYAELERSPRLPDDFAHVVLVDPPACGEHERLASRSPQESAYVHRVWGEAEQRFALSAVGVQLAQRSTLIACFRDLRDAGEVGGEELREALRGSGRTRAARRPRPAASASLPSSTWSAESPRAATERSGSYPQRGQI